MKSRWRFRLDRTRTILLASIAVVCAGGLAVFFSLRWQRPSPAELLAEARAALQRKQYDLAEELAADIEPDQDLWAQGRLVAGEAATRAGRYQAAIEHFSSIPRDESENSLLATFSLAEACRAYGRLSDAERHYRHVLQRQPGNDGTLVGIGAAFHVPRQAWRLDARLARTAGRPGAPHGPERLPAALREERS
jgi:tetratricopeptide (TPR) repeat protein